MCLCNADIAVKAACCLWTIKDHLLISKTEHGSKSWKKTDRRTDVRNVGIDWECACERERKWKCIPLFLTCLHLGLKWLRLLKCGSFNCVNMQPTQKLLEFPSCCAFRTFFPSGLLLVCQYLFFISLSHTVHTQPKPILHKQSLSFVHIYNTPLYTNCHLCCRQAVFFASLCLFDIYFQPHPCDPVKQGVFLKVEIEMFVFRPFVLLYFLQGPT